MYLSHLNHSADADSSKLSFLVRAQKKLYYFEYNEKNDETPILSIKMININPPFSYFHYNILGSINGLVLLYGCQDHILCICNPVTRKYVKLPEIKTECDDDQYVHLSSGFGYLPLTDEYKFVALYWRKLGFIEVVVYTLGSGKAWRIVRKLDYEISKYDADRGVFANGALHWVERAGRVLAFYSIEEKFLEPLSPPPSPLHGVRPLHAIGDLGGVLYYVTRHVDQILECTCLNIWILKKKDDMEELVEHEPLGWSKEFSLPGREPLAVTKSGGVLCFSGTSLYIYDAIASYSKKLVNFDFLSQIFPHRITLLSLKELGEGNVEMFESAKVEIERRDFPKI